MKIGIYLGSFNPIHNGHVEAIEAALTHGKCKKVIVVPTMHNPWKKEQPLPIEERVYMIGLATKQFGGMVEVSSIELTLQPPYYSCNTLDAIRREYPNDELAIIIGADTFNSIHLWHDFNERIQPHFSLVVLERKGVELNPSENTSQMPFSYIMSCASQDISSTQIRELVKNGAKTIPNLPKNVAEYIFKKDFYTK